MGQQLQHMQFDKCIKQIASEFYIFNIKCIFSFKIMLKLEKVSKFKKQQKTKQDKPQNNAFQNFNPSTKYPTYEQQFDPQFIHSNFSQEEGSSYFQKLYQRHYEQRQFQDSILTMFIYKKITLIRVTLMSMSIMSIFLSIFQNQLQELQEEILVIHSTITAFMIFMIASKQIYKEDLKKKQLIRQKKQNTYAKFAKNTAVQICIAIMHPNLATKDCVVSVSQPIYDNWIPLNINNVLAILMQLRIYFLFLAIINSSIYCNTRANRLCRIYSTKENILFGVKSLFQYRPLTLLIVLYSSMVIIFGQMISLSERDYQLGFQEFSNSVWFIIVTMGTLGYGDYTPATYPGRIISFFAAISGIIISSLLILTLGRYLSMSSGENKAHVTLKRLELRKLLEKYSQDTINFTSLMMFQRGKQPSLGSQKNKMVMEQLKRKTEKVKFTIRKIKNMVDTDNLKEEINRLFEALSESLNEIYKFQEQYSQLLIELYKKQKDTIQEIQFSFTTEIENIIKDR